MARAGLSVLASGDPFASASPGAGTEAHAMMSGLIFRVFEMS